MTTDELKKEAEECAEKFFGKPTDLVDLDNLRIFKNGYLASAEPREKRIAELEQENAELKEQNRSYGQLLDEGSATLMQERLKNYKQLTKAKKIIKRYLTIGVGGKITQNYLDVTKEAEQFLKDSEVEK
jgi:hypothetical protein